MHRVGILTISDKASVGERIDTAGPAIKEVLHIYDVAMFKVEEIKIINDDKDGIKNELIKMSDEKKYDLIFTTGGTGFSKRDNTPEATMEIMTKNAPGISEYMRMKGAEKIKRAILSRGVSVIRNDTLIINLPGSEKGVRENISFILDILDHSLKILKGIDMTH